MCAVSVHTHMFMCVSFCTNMSPYYPGCLVLLSVNGHTGMSASLAPAVVTVSVAVKSMGPELGGLCVNLGDHRQVPSLPMPWFSVCKMGWSLYLLVEVLGRNEKLTHEKSSLQYVA